MDSYGFDLSENGLSWTKSEVAGFSVMLGAVPPDSVLSLRVAAQPFIKADQILRQHFFVFINGTYIGFRILETYEDLEFVLPRNVLSTRGMRLEFVIPTASSPKSVGVSQDVRKLGIAISGVSFTLRDRQ